MTREKREPFPLVGAIEAGGTKVICSLGTGPDDVRERVRLDTTTPNEVMPGAADFFRQAVSQHGPLEALGVVTFGPVDLRPESENFGCIMKTPKAGWEGASWIEPFGDLINGPIFIDTDVNGAALGEAAWGAARGLSTVVYITVGTGIGGGILVNGAPVHGLLHPEVGHMRIPRSREEIDAFGGICPFHGDCLEGLACGPAIAERWGAPAHTLGVEHPAWELQAEVMSWALVNLVVTLSPERIILGGGVNQNEQLFTRMRVKTREKLNGYVDVPEITQAIETVIVPPHFGQDAGLMGAIALAHRGLGCL